MVKNILKRREDFLPGGNKLKLAKKGGTMKSLIRP
jgi:hypothetical protein